MVFNNGGRLIKTKFKIDDETLEPVKSFCYLGFDIVPSGVVTRAMNTLCDKAKKALRPLMSAIAKFDLPAKLAIQLFHTYIFPRGHSKMMSPQNWRFSTPSLPLSPFVTFWLTPLPPMSPGKYFLTKYLVKDRK